MRNPFTLGIVKKKDFCDREKEIDDLLRYAENGQNVVLFSPRRYGKSSLVSQVFELLAGKGLLTIYVDLFPISSERDFVTRFSTAIFRSIGKGADPRTMAAKFKNLFSRFVPSIEVRPEGYSVSVKFDPTAETGFLLEDIMDGLYRYVRKKGLRACVALDEFQEITELPESKKIEGTLRSHIQFHTEIAYFYIGSRRRILSDMFTNKSRPFYKSAFLYTLKEISKKDFLSYIGKRFKDTGKVCPTEVAEKIYDTVRGYPYYVQKLSSIAWDITKKECSEKTFEEAYGILLDIESMDFEGIWSGMTLIQKSLLKAIAGDPTSSPYSREFLERHRLSIGGTQKAMQVLFSRDLIEKDPDGRYRLTDPVLGAWLSR